MALAIFYNYSALSLAVGLGLREIDVHPRNWMHRTNLKLILALGRGIRVSNKAMLGVTCRVGTSLDEGLNLMYSLT